MLMTGYNILSSIVYTDVIFFIANKSKQSIYLLHLYLNKSDLIVLEGLFKGRSTPFYLLNNNLFNYNLWL